MFYHGSVQKNLSELRPRDGKIFASPDPRVASIFLAGAQRAFCRPIGSRMFAFIADDREAVLSRDCGGAVYGLSGTQFRPVPGGNPSVEWFATEKIKPIMSFTYESSIAAIIAHGVQLYFVSLATLDQIEDVDKTGALLGSSILTSVLARESENKILRTLLLKHGSLPNTWARTPSHVTPQI